MAGSSLLRNINISAALGVKFGISIWNDGRNFGFAKKLRCIFTCGQKFNLMKDLCLSKNYEGQKFKFFGLYGRKFCSEIARFYKKIVMLIYKIRNPGPESGSQKVGFRTGFRIC